MTKATLRIMSGLENRLNTLVRLEVQACGHYEGRMKAQRQWDKLMRWLEGEVEKLALNGGEK